MEKDSTDRQRLMDDAATRWGIPVTELAKTMQASRNGKPKVESFTGADLLQAKFAEPKMVVDGIITEGLGILAGKPKLGKSWWALNVGLGVSIGGVALGKIKVERGSVLFLALEDT